MTAITLVLPTVALEQVNQWVDTSGLSRAKFYSAALILGARAMTSSLGPDFVDALTPEDRKYMSESANVGVTPEVLLQIIMGDKTPANVNDSEQATTQFVVSLPDDMFKQFNKAADSIGMVHEKFCSLAFVTGARLAASTLDHSSIFPLELLIQSIEGNITPEMLMQAVMKRNAQANPQKASGSKKQ